MLIKDVNSALVWDLGCAEKQRYENIEKESNKTAIMK